MEETNIARSITLKNPGEGRSDASGEATSAATARTIVEVDQVDFSYRASRALYGINLQIPEKRVRPLSDLPGAESRHSCVASIG